MINTKSFSVIDKHHLKGNIHVVGVGAVGSQVVERLVRLNLSDKIIVYDDDVVEEKNLNNQAYLYEHIGIPKVEAIADLSQKIDPTGKIRTRKKKVEMLAHQANDVVVLAIDNFHSRGKILQSLSGNPLVISGGISSIGGNFEVVRGAKAYKTLAEEYLSLESGLEYDENDLTPCGSPISIYHRIGFAASLMCDAIIKHHNTTEELNYNVVFDAPNLILMQL